MNIVNGFPQCGARLQHFRQLRSPLAAGLPPAVRPAFKFAYTAQRLLLSCAAKALADVREPLRFGTAILSRYASFGALPREEFHLRSSRLHVLGSLNCLNSRQVSIGMFFAFSVA